jgi:hypothetical protein
MIRFIPDSWWDALMRPLDMASPEGNMYVEVLAPDLRLAAAVFLALAVLVCWRRVRLDWRPTMRLLLLTLLAMIPWLFTTGNGRYFPAFLLLLGPLCVGLARLLPISRSMKFAALGLLLALQGFLIVDASPFGSWSLAYWGNAAYFPVATPPAQPRSYVTVTPISYSLIAPQFPAQSRWMNLSAAVAGPREAEYSRKWLANAQLLYLVAPSIPSQTGDDNQPTSAVVQVFRRLIEPRGLSIAPGTRCEFLSSAGLVSMALRQGAPKDAQELSRLGFWLCPMQFDPQYTAKARLRDLPLDTVFEAVEKLCPRFFPAGESQTQLVDGGATRHYSSSDTRVYVMEDGEVLYKFWRSLNPVTIGSRAEVLAGQAHVDCTKIRAPTWRGGGP